MVKKAYKYRFYPDEEQTLLLAQTFGCVRYVYNEILRYRTDAYYAAKESVSYIGANARLTALKKLAELAFLNEVSSVPLQQCLRHQQSAFSNFFAGRTQYPTFKKKNGQQAAEFTYRAFSYKNGKLFIAKSKTPLAIRWSRELPSEPSTITLTKNCAGRYFVSCLCEFEPELLPVIEKTIGIDLGITDIIITSDGEKSGNPRHTGKYAAKLAKAQRQLSKKKLGSSNRRKAKVKVARVHAIITDCRKDFLHKQSCKLVNENQVICAETLRIKNMIKNRKLSKSIACSSWGELTRQIEYKANFAGKTFVKIDQFFPSSKRCDCCGYSVDKMPLDIRTWTCPECLNILDRDINAANNIKRQGMSLIAFGATVKPL
jgi:putative transposase